MLILLVTSVFKVPGQEATVTPSPDLVFTSPTPGQAVQGTVIITARANINSSERIDLRFSYSDDPRETWFTIAEEGEISRGEISFEWDTTTITDGNYSLRLVVETLDGEHYAYVHGLRVRNYSPVETSTPMPTPTPAPRDTRTPAVISTSTMTPLSPTQTSLPPNPARITTRDISESILKGIAATLILFAGFGFYQFIRNRNRGK